MPYISWYNGSVGDIPWLGFILQVATSSIDGAVVCASALPADGVKRRVIIMANNIERSIIMANNIVDDKEERNHIVGGFAPPPHFVKGDSIFVTLFLTQLDILSHCVG